ncbi:ATP-binding cassette sub-family C member 4-like [Zophobas morio]|uniref:ATP-binding cassette sub-family C member 4-like n=1 Tax=Zophobas morio TaxID=2755281 RepID=UPI0030837EA8
MNYEKKTHKPLNPVKSTNFFSKLFFTYTAKLFLKGYNKELIESDIYQVLPSYESKQLGQKLEKEWTKQARNNRNSLPHLLFKCFGKEYFLLVLTLIIPLTLTAVKPRLTKRFILYFASDRTTFPKSEACAYGALLVLVEFATVLYVNNFDRRIITFSLKIRAGLTSLIYRRVLDLKSVSIGRSVNLITKDVSEFEEFLLMVTLMLRDVLNILVLCYVLYTEAGWLFVILIFIIVTAVTISGILAFFVKKLQVRTLAKTDMRLQTTKEVLGGISLIKYYQWGDYYQHKIQEIRKKEVSLLTKVFILLSTSIIISSSVIDFSWYIIVVGLIFSGVKSNVGTLFVILNSLNALRLPLQHVLPRAVLEFATIIAAITRIENFLRATSRNIDEPSTNIPLLSVKTPHVEFEYSSGITAITGPVGGGKTYFLTILAKEDMKSFAYASQEPWLFPATIKQNILFGSGFDQARYLEVLRVCALLDEVQDSTVVADKGANLSKGQQARINLARAVYKDCDVYLIDDCLCHLDVMVADFVYEECLRKFLKDKITLVVTQNVQHIGNSDRLVTIENGTIKSDDKQLVKKKFTTKENTTTETKLVENLEADDNVYQEVKASGKVKLEAYQKYLEACDGISKIFGIFFLVVLTQVLKTSVIKLQANWIRTEQLIFKNSTTTKALENRQRMIYVLPILIIAATVLFIVNTTLYWFLAKKASISIHKLLLSKIVNSSIEFFNSHFAGNILNRFSEDMLYLDEFVPRTFYDMLRNIAATTGIIILAATVNVYFLIACLAFGAIIITLRMIYIRTGRALKRLEFSTRSPLVGHINATLEGLATIRISKQQNLQREEFDKRQNLYTSASYMYMTCEKAFHFTIDSCGVCFSTFAIILFLVLDEDISSDNVGLGLLQIFLLTITQQFLCRSWTRLENYMTTVERILQYTKQKQENENGVVVTNWPSQGEIRYEHVYFGYNTTNVLNDLNFVVKSKTKFAIVGRTAAGKTSLTSLLFRPYGFKGHIFIDNVDIATLSLDLLRSNVFIISQESTLFSGSLRDNIDPTKKFSDDEIWQALKMVHLAGLFQSLEDKICQDTKLSAGQERLVCLCRAIVRKSKVVILDEVTANVDSDTESVIHSVISSSFGDSTVIVITHKFRYILGFDNVLVLDNGTVAQVGDPRRLLEDRNGIFYKLYEKNHKQ